MIEPRAAEALPSAGREGASCDVLVVGGGINGAGIARDLAGRGLKVLLCERDDLAQHTSSSSTKLIHGGLRYLEHYEFSLVRKALAERERLLKSAPHIMSPLSFVMPHDPSMRPVWMIRIGLFLYDHLARREWLPASRAVRLAQHPAGAALKPQFTRGFEYSDGWVDDARLVVLCALDAAAHGARVLTRCLCERAVRSSSSSGWRATLRGADGRVLDVAAKAIVNATGPWAAQFLSERVGQPKPKPLRLVKGSHIVVRKLFDHDHAYIFQNADGRIIFAIPYEGSFTLLGTTEVEHTGPIGQPQIDAEETAYLCDQANRYFAQPVSPGDVVWSYSGVRPLLDDEAGDASAVTRDYMLELDTHGGAPLLNVWGGKITTFRKLAEEAADLLCRELGVFAARWTADAALPGGDLSGQIAPSGRPDRDIAAFDAAIAAAHPYLPEGVRRRWVRSYGSRVALLLAKPLGSEVAPGLFEGELHYLKRHEWARSADDVLWRRSKLGLHYRARELTLVAQWWERFAFDETATLPFGAVETTWN